MLPEGISFLNFYGSYGPSVNGPGKSLQKSRYWLQYFPDTDCEPFASGNFKKVPTCDDLRAPEHKESCRNEESMVVCHKCKAIWLTSLSMIFRGVVMCSPAMALYIRPHCSPLCRFVLPVAFSIIRIRHFPNFMRVFCVAWFWRSPGLLQGITE